MSHCIPTQVGKGQMNIGHNRINSNPLEKLQRKHFPEKVKMESNIWGGWNFFFLALSLLTSGLFLQDFICSGLCWLNGWCNVYRSTIQRINGQRSLSCHLWDHLSCFLRTSALPRSPSFQSPTSSLRSQHDGNCKF